jgi:hypothetical protein
MVAPPKLPTPKSSLRCLQINLQHSKTASLSLSQILLHFNIDIAFLQEPYAVTADPPQIANVQPGYSSHQHLLSKNNHAFGAVSQVAGPILKLFHSWHRTLHEIGYHKAPCISPVPPKFRCYNRATVCVGGTFALFVRDRHKCP